MGSDPLFSGKAKAVFLLLVVPLMLTAFRFLSQQPCALRGTSVAAKDSYQHHNENGKSEDSSACSCSCGSPLEIGAATEATLENTSSKLAGSNETYWELTDFLRSNSVQIKIRNAEPDTEYSVMAVSAGNFSKAGVRVDLLTNGDDAKGALSGASVSFEITICRRIFTVGPGKKCRIVCMYLLGVWGSLHLFAEIGAPIAHRRLVLILSFVSASSR